MTETPQESELTGFGPGFTWGVATSAYQVEGAATAAGRGPSVWDTFAAEPGRILDGTTGATACDHYHRYREDVDLMARLGVDAYRFSFAWPRIQPTGRGTPEHRGLDFYDRLVDALLEKGIEPVPTLFHWDTPQALEDQGGWLDRDITCRFAEYAAIVADRFTDRISRWITVNEPMVVPLFGHAVGVHAPGRELLFDALPVAHHLLLAHGRAAQALRAAGATSIGIANNHAPTWAASGSSDDVAAADLYETLINRLFADPLLLGSYPEGFAELMPGPVADDLAVIGGSLDFYGINYYAPARIGAPAGHASTAVTDGVALPDGLPFEPREVEGHETTDFGWPVVPEAFGELLRTMRGRYGDRLPPIVITENGCAINDGPGPDGQVHDEQRITYLASHLGALREAIADGVDVRGYFCWSLLDNFEWAAGNTQRFGLVHVDYDTLRRTPKDSFDWYAGLIAANRNA